MGRLISACSIFFFIQLSPFKNNFLIVCQRYKGHCNTFEPRHEEINVVFEQVRHKLSCTSTEDGWRLEISGLESRRIVLSV